MGTHALLPPTMHALHPTHPTTCCMPYPAAALVAWRNRKATILRMVAPFLFLLLALLIDRALQANTSTSASFQDLQNPQPQQLGSIPKCSDDLYIGTKPCTEILFSPNNTVAQVSCGERTMRVWRRGKGGRGNR